MLKKFKRITMRSPFVCDPRYRESFAQLQAELHGMPDDELIAVRGDVIGVVVAAIDALPDYREMRPAISLQLPSFDLERFDRLEMCAFALAYAHASYVLIRQQPVPLGPLCSACMDCRARLEAVANYRQRAFTLFTATHDHVRRAINFVCWNTRDYRSSATRRASQRRRRELRLIL